jgi:hypothetical protein
LVYFFPFWYVVPRKIWQTWSYLCIYKHVQRAEQASKKRLKIRQSRGHRFESRNGVKFLGFYVCTHRNALCTYSVT